MPVYPRLEDPKLSYNLYRRKELYDYKLDPPSKENTTVAPTASTFTPLKTQELESRIFSPYTPYRRAMFFHGVGTGKSALFSMIVENNRAYHNAVSEGLARKPALILSPNRDILNNYLKDIRRVGDYEPPTDRFTTQESQMEAVRSLVKSAYEFQTIGTFINLLIRTKNESEEAWNELIENYSARIIVIDEVHKISTAGERTEEVHVGTEKQRYDRMNEFLHEVQGCKIFLLSATPVWDNISEFPMRMNLILDKENQLPLDFQNAYFNTDNTIKKDKYDELMNKIGPYISYIRPDESDVKKIYEGETKKEWGVGYTKINISKASSYQEYWIPKLKEISQSLRGKGTRTPFSDAGRTEEISASNFIFCGNIGIDDNFCDDGCWLGIDFAEHTKNDDSPYKDNWPCLNFYHKHITVTSQGTTKKFKYNSENLGKYIRNNIDVFAPKIKRFIDILKDKGASQELVFAYNEGVTQPGGCYNMGLILQLFDWKWLYVNPYTNTRKVKQNTRLSTAVTALSKTAQRSKSNTLSMPRENKTFIVLTGDIMSPSDRGLLLQEFNNQLNNQFNGNRKIRLVIGSQAIGTGIDIKNVRQFHVISAHWNRSAIDQAEGRVYRTGSHADLKDDQKYLKVYNHALVFENDPKHGIDIEMYVENENKTAPLANLVRLIKRAAYDCPLTYKRNVLTKDEKNTLACDLQDDCNYECRGYPGDLIDRTTDVWSYIVEPNKFITSTAIENYSSKETAAIEDQIREIFARKFSINEKRLVDSLIFDSNEDIPGFNHGIARSALRRMRLRRVPIINKYGFVSYLGNFGDVWYLTDDPYHTLYSDLESVNVIRAMYDNNLGEILDVESLSVPVSCDKKDVPIDITSIGGKIWELFNGENAYSQDLYTNLTGIKTGDIGIKLNELILQKYLERETLRHGIGASANPLEKLKNFVLTRRKKDYYEIKDGNTTIGFFHIAYGDKKDIPKNVSTVNQDELNKKEIRTQLTKYIKTIMGREPPVVKKVKPDQVEDEIGLVVEVDDRDEAVIAKYAETIAEYVQANNIRPDPLDKLLQADLRTPLKIITSDHLAWRTVNKGSDHLAWRTVNKGSGDANLCFISKQTASTTNITDNTEHYGQLRNKVFFIIPPSSKIIETQEESSSSSSSSGKKVVKGKKTSAKTTSTRTKTGQKCTSISAKILLEIIVEKDMITFFAERMDIFREMIGKDAEIKVFGQAITEDSIHLNFDGEPCSRQNVEKCKEVKKIMGMAGFYDKNVVNKLKILYYFTLKTTGRKQLCNLIQRWLEMHNRMK